MQIRGKKGGKKAKIPWTHQGSLQLVIDICATFCQRLQIACLPAATDFGCLQRRKSALDTSIVAGVPATLQESQMLEPTFDPRP